MATGLTIWRIEKQRHVSTAFRGYGSLEANGRWHRKGTQVAYASEHPGVAALEKLVWLESYDRAQRSDYVLIPIKLDTSKHLEVLDLSLLPPGWDGYPHLHITQEIGTRWFDERRTVTLEVPSAVIHIAKNYLINPFHPDFHELEVGDPIPFAWDSRLFRRS